MLKELQEQMKAQKEKIVAPLVDQLKQIYQGFDVSAALNDEGNEINVAVESNGAMKTKVSFTVGEQMTYSSESFEYITKDNAIVGIKSHPLTIDFNLIQYTFQLINSLLQSLQEANEEVKEVKEENENADNKVIKENSAAQE